MSLVRIFLLAAILPIAPLPVAPCQTRPPTSKEVAAWRAYEYPPLCGSLSGVCPRGPKPSYHPCAPPTPTPQPKGTP